MDKYFVHFTLCSRPVLNVDWKLTAERQMTEEKLNCYLLNIHSNYTHFCLLNRLGFFNTYVQLKQFDNQISKKNLKACRNWIMKQMLKEELLTELQCPGWSQTLRRQSRPRCRRRRRQAPACCPPGAWTWGWRCRRSCAAPSCWRTLPWTRPPEDTTPSSYSSEGGRDHLATESDISERPPSRT